MIAIAIDGPAGAGKSTIARKAAALLGYIYVDTGALYRTLSLKFTALGLDASEASASIVLPQTKISIKFKNGEQRMILDGTDVTDKIRTPEVSMMASAVSAIGSVRAYLLETQRRLARENNVIMDGRDIGTVVLPDAQIKIFLTASPEERAMRRYKELTEKGQKVDYKDVLEDMKIRDYNDSHREIAPLKPAQDSVTVDTTGISLEDSIELLCSIIKGKLEG